MRRCDYCRSDAMGEMGDYRYLTCYKYRCRRRNLNGEPRLSWIGTFFKGTRG